MWIEVCLQPLIYWVFSLGIDADTTELEVEKDKMGEGKYEGDMRHANRDEERDIESASKKRKKKIHRKRRTKKRM